MGPEMTQFWTWDIKRSQPENFWERVSSHIKTRALWGESCVSPRLCLFTLNMIMGGFVFVLRWPWLDKPNNTLDCKAKKKQKTELGPLMTLLRCCLSPAKLTFRLFFNDFLLWTILKSLLNFLQYFFCFMFSEVFLATRHVRS